MMTLKLLLVVYNLSTLYPIKMRRFTSRPNLDCILKVFLGFECDLEDQPTDDGLIGRPDKFSVNSTFRNHRLSKITIRKKRFLEMFDYSKTTTFRIRSIFRKLDKR